MSQKLALGLALALGAVSPFAGAAHAGLSDSAFVAPLSDQLQPLENADFIYNGRQYCWYEDGWRGPGWYWCGYAHWEGAGWGGLRVERLAHHAWRQLPPRPSSPPHRRSRRRPLGRRRPP
jgi:hypothetical protein